MRNISAQSPTPGTDDVRFVVIISGFLLRGASASKESTDICISSQVTQELLKSPPKTNKNNIHRAHIDHNLLVILNWGIYRRSVFV